MILLHQKLFILLKLFVFRFVLHLWTFKFAQKVRKKEVQSWVK
jgi:hypothetical protein